MQTQLDCIPCFIRQALEALRQVCDDEEVIKRSLKRVLKETSEFDLNLSPPEMGQKIHAIIREESGHDDPYRKIKKYSTELAISLSKDAKKLIDSSDNKFAMAVKFAIAGNVMDYAIYSLDDKDRIYDTFNNVAKHKIDEKEIALLEDEIKKANTILYLGDNAGETVFDRLLINCFPKNKRVIYAVKASPIINDATLEDAKDAGLDSVCELITNGTNAPGTILESCSKEFIEIYNNADVVIGKGQGNFESLNQEKRKVYFLLQIKCAALAKKYSYSVGDWIVANTIKILEESK